MSENKEQSYYEDEIDELNAIRKEKEGNSFERHTSFDIDVEAAKKGDPIELDKAAVNIGKMHTVENAPRYGVFSSAGDKGIDGYNAGTLHDSVIRGVETAVDVDEAGAIWSSPRLSFWDKFKETCSWVFEGIGNFFCLITAFLKLYKNWRRGNTRSQDIP